MKSYDHIKKILKDPAIIFMAGKPGSGKSHFIKKLISHLTISKKVKTGYVFTGTAFNDDYKFIDAKRVSTFSEANLRKILRHQRDVKGKPPPIFLILDDLMATAKWDGRLMQHMISCYRHYNLRIIIATQYIKKINPSIRECTRIAVIWPQSTANAIKSIRESFIPEMRHPEELFKGLSQHEAILIFNYDKDIPKSMKKIVPVKAPS